MFKIIIVTTYRFPHNKNSVLQKHRLMGKGFCSDYFL